MKDKTTHLNNELHTTNKHVSHPFDENVKKVRIYENSFIKFLYNSRKETVLGRDALSWGNFENDTTITYI